MAEEVRGVTWEAYEHHHDPKGNDWVWVVVILAVAAGVAAMLLGNLLFGIVILIGGIVMTILAVREPRVIPYAITQRGLRIEDRLYPYSSLEGFFIDEDHPAGPQLLARSEKMFMPLIVIPIPDDHIDDIEYIISSRLPEIPLEEPFFNKLLEAFGF